MRLCIRKGYFMEQQLLENGLKAISDYCLNHSKYVQADYERACRVIREFYGELGSKEYDPAHDDEIMNQVLAGKTLTPESNYVFCRYVFRVLGMMKDYFAGQPFRKKYPMFSRYKFELGPEYLNFADEFRDWLRLEPQTILGLYSIARDFAYYLQQNEVRDFSAIDQNTLYSFMTWEYETYPATLDRVGYCLRLMCQFLNQKGFDDVPTQILPFAFPTPRKKTYPSFSQDDITKILANPDRNTTAGKRDYAILYLASTTGMRAIDIANLKLSDINWEDQTIHFIQSKTKNAVSLPINSEAISALADYILNGRPTSGEMNVFLSLKAPYHRIGQYGGLSNVIAKHIRESGVHKEFHDGKSFHAFRRSMGAWLLDSESEPEMISQILGHHSRDVLKAYLPLAPSKMNVCALDFKGIEIRLGVYK